MKNIKIKITKEQDYLFRSTGNICNSSNGDIYMNIPYWLKETDEEYVYEYLTTEQLPDDIRNGLDKNKYSEEELKEAFKQSREALIFEKDMPPVYENFEEWFEQFKKQISYDSTRKT